jgi:ATP/maltotriose-dependent transcriptional regulator MalT
VSGCLTAVWGDVLAELGGLEGALAKAWRGVEQSELAGDWSLFGWSCLCLIRVLFSAGDRAGAQEIVHKVDTIARASNLPPWILKQVEAWQVRLWLADNKLEAAFQWAGERGLVAAQEPQPPNRFDFFSLNDHVILARILIAQDLADAIDFGQLYRGIAPSFSVE